MQRLAKRKVEGDTFRVDFVNDIIVLYKKDDIAFSIYELSTLKEINKVELEDNIVNISISYPSIVITIKTHITTINAYSKSQDLCVYISGCIDGYLLESKKILAVYEDTFYIYSMHNQEESRYNYEILKVIDNKVLFYHNRVINMMQNNIFTEIYRVIGPLHSNFSFDLYKNKVTIMNGFDIYNANYRIKFDFLDSYPGGFRFPGDFIYFTMDNKLYLYDRKENRNTNLQRYSKKTEHLKGIRPVNLCKQWSKEYIKFDKFEVFDKYLIVMHRNNLYSYKMVEDDVHDYILCDMSYDYKEAECEFDVSDISI